MADRSERITDDEAKFYLGLIEAKVAQFLGPRRRPRDHALDLVDLVQQAFAALQARFHLFDPARSTLATFIARVTESVLLDVARQAAADKRNPDRAPRTDADRNFDPEMVADNTDGPSAERLQDLEREVREWLNRLPAALRQLMEDVGQHGITEAAHRHGVHPDTVKRRLNELRSRWEGLRGYIDP